MIISVDTQKVFDKFHIPFDRTLSKIEREQKPLILISGIYKNWQPTS